MCCDTHVMGERATLRLDSGREVRVEVVREDADREEIVVRRADDRESRRRSNLIAVIEEHLATATPHASGTTDRLLAADRERPY